MSASRSASVKSRSVPDTSADISASRSRSRSSSNTQSVRGRSSEILSRSTSTKSKSNERPKSLSPRSHSSSVNSNTNKSPHTSAVQWIMDRGYKIQYTIRVDGTENTLLWCTTPTGTSILLFVNGHHSLGNTYPTLHVGMRDSISVPVEIKAAYTNALSSIYTGFAFITSKGIHTVTRQSSNGQHETETSSRKIARNKASGEHIYGYNDTASAIHLLKLQSDTTITIPYVVMTDLIHENRNRTAIDLIDGSTCLVRFNALISKADLKKHLKYYRGRYAILAPTNDAIVSAISGKDLSTNDIINIVLAHVVLGDYPTGTDIKTNMSRTYTSVQGTKITVDGTKINGIANFIKVDGLGTNGYVHVIDNVIIPTSVVEYSGQNDSAYVAGTVNISKILPYEKYSISLSHILHAEKQLRAIEKKLIHNDLNVIIGDMETAIVALHNISRKLHDSNNTENRINHLEQRYLDFYLGRKQHESHRFTAPYVLQPIHVKDAVDISNVILDDRAADSNIKILGDSQQSVTLAAYISDIGAATTAETQRHNHVIYHTAIVTSLRSSMDRMLETIKNNNIDISILPK